MDRLDLNPEQVAAWIAGAKLLEMKTVRDLLLKEGIELQIGLADEILFTPEFPN